MLVYVPGGYVIGWFPLSAESIQITSVTEQKDVPIARQTQCLRTQIAAKILRLFYAG